MWSVYRFLVRVIVFRSDFVVLPIFFFIKFDDNYYSVQTSNHVNSVSWSRATAQQITILVNEYEL